MVSAPEQPHRADCPSRYRLDRHLARELEPGMAGALDRHLHRCARCAARWSELCEAHAATQTELPDWLSAGVHRQCSRDAPGAPAANSTRWGLGRRGWSLAGVAAAAALLLFVGVRQQPARLTSDGVRTKGGPHVTFYVLHDGSTRPGIDGDRVQPGDRLQFAYSSRRARHLAILSVDGAGKASAYYEVGGRAGHLPAGRRELLDRSTLLDATLGEEIVYALFCDHPVVLAPLLRALEHAPEAAPSAPGCVVDSLHLVKVAR